MGIVKTIEAVHSFKTGFDDELKATVEINGMVPFMNFEPNPFDLFNDDLKLVYKQARMIYQKRFDCIFENYPIHAAAFVRKDGTVFIGFARMAAREKENYSKKRGREVALAKAIGYAAINLSLGETRTKKHQHTLSVDVNTASNKDLIANLKEIMMDVIIDHLNKSYKKGRVEGYLLDEDGEPNYIQVTRDDFLDNIALHLNAPMETDNSSNPTL